MLVVRYREFGGPEVLEPVDVPVPEPGPGEIRVRAEAIGVGMPDILMRTGNYAWIPPLPVVPGNELAGSVAAVGEGVTSLAVGERVYVNARELPRRGGGYAEAAVVPAAAVFSLPDAVSAVHAVALGNVQLAWLLLNYVVTPRAGQRILVHAAAGGAGSALVQLARSQGLEVYGVAGSSAKARYVTELGASAAIDRSAESIAERVAALTGGAGVEYVYDSVGGPGFAGDFAMLAPMGTLVMFGHIAGWPDPDILTPMRERFGDSLGFRLFSIHVLDGRPVERRGAMEAAIAAMVAGKAIPRIHSTLPLAEAAEAHRMLEAGTVTGKVVLVP